MAARGMVPPGHNPVAQMDDKPTWTPQEREFLEVAEAGLYIHAASLVVRQRAHGLHCGLALVATYLYTGMRESEAYQLRVTDVDLSKRLISVRWRNKGMKTEQRVKNVGSVRTIPIPMELYWILVAYLAGPDRPSGELLFATPTRPNSPITDWCRDFLSDSARIAFDMAPTHMKAR